MRWVLEAGEISIPPITTMEICRLEEKCFKYAEMFEIKVLPNSNIKRADWVNYKNNELEEVDKAESVFELKNFLTRADADSIFVVKKLPNNPRSPNTRLSFTIYKIKEPDTQAQVNMLLEEFRL